MVNPHQHTNNHSLNSTRISSPQQTGYSQYAVEYPKTVHKRFTSQMQSFPLEADINPVKYLEENGLLAMFRSSENL